MTSCPILSCPRSRRWNPMRLAGTCSRYSKNAMPQLRIAARYHGRSPRLRRCAYQAKVMNTLERTSSATVCATTVLIGARPGGAPRRQRAAGGIVAGGHRHSAFDDVDRQAAARRFLVLRHHVGAGLAHGLDDLVQADVVRAVATQR